MSDLDLSAASAYCKKLAKTHYENFPVGRFISKKLRPHIHALYAFARTADDFADESEHEGHRLERLAAWRAMLYEAKAGKAETPIFKALQETIHTFDLPVEWLDDLIKAFEFDVRHNRHSNLQSLLDYSKQSANPVGRIMLWVHGYRDEKRLVMSDAICTALQLTNFWQDVAIDWKKNRVYLPQDRLLQYGYTEDMLSRGEATLTYQHMLSELSQQTKDLFLTGKPLCDSVDGWLQFELKLIWNGGMRVLEKLSRVNYDVFHQRPQLTPVDYLTVGLRSTLFWKKA